MDIVERLKQIAEMQVGPHMTCSEAAAEIERLRAEVERLRKVHEDDLALGSRIYAGKDRDFQEQLARAEAAERKVERLREALKHVENWWLKDGIKHFNGAPYAIFSTRAALKETGP